MQVQSRVLGYLNAKELSDAELIQISGGTQKGTIEPTNRITGPSGQVDVDIDQIWD